MIYSQSDRVEVQAFTRQGDSEEVVIGLPASNTFLALPAEALEILDSLSRGRNVGEAQMEFARAHGVEPDVNELLQHLESRGFVRPWREKVDDELGPAATAGRALRPHFAHLPESLAGRFFHPFALALYLATIAAAAALAVAHPSLIPGRANLVFSEHRTTKVIALAAIVYVSIFLHELAHLLAAKARGVEARIGISHRLWFLVAETDLSGLWALPRRQRYLPVLAGPLLDGLSAALLFLLLFAHHRGALALPPFVDQLVRALIFAYLLRLLWQCCFFLRTDLYYLVTTFFNCKNLMKDTETFIKNLFLRAIGSPRRIDQSHIPLRERRVIGMYSMLWAGGRALAFWMLFFVTLPVVFRYLSGARLAVQQGLAGGRYQYIDSVLVGAINLLPFLLGLSLWISAIVRRKSSL